MYHSFRSKIYNAFCLNVEISEIVYMQVGVARAYYLLISSLMVLSARVVARQRNQQRASFDQMELLIRMVFENAKMHTRIMQYIILYLRLLTW